MGVSPLSSGLRSKRWGTFRNRCGKRRSILRRQSHFRARKWPNLIFACGMSIARTVFEGFFGLNYLGRTGVSIDEKQRKNSDRL